MTGIIQLLNTYSYGVRTATIEKGYFFFFFLTKVLIYKSIIQV